MSSFLAVALFAVLSLCQAAPQYGAYPQPQAAYQTTPVPIVSQAQEVNADGSFQYSYQTGNGIAVQEVGYLKNAGVPEQEAQVVEGLISYTANDGTPIQLRYIADEAGFRAQGDHLPTPPPVPVEIQRALDFIATQPQDQYDDQGRIISSARIAPAPLPVRASPQPQPYRG